MLQHGRKIFLGLLIVIALAFIILLGKHFNLNLQYQPTHPEESTSVLTLPYCGFFHLYGYRLSEEDKKETMRWCEQMLANDSQSIVLLQINLCNYSNSPISENALEQLDNIFSAFSTAKKQIILRFLYDWDGKALETEPANLTQILSHMEQVAPVVNRYQSHIFLLQGVFTGNCGEMNQTHYGTNENIIQLMEYLSSVTDKNIFLSVRTPAQVRTITKSGNPLSEKEAYRDSLSARLGLFNDGMLGNAFDCGTYDDTSFADTSDYTEKGTRKEEISFQNTLCQFVPNGGEAVLDNPYNDLNNAITDLSRMHISYLSCDHDATVLNKWKKTIYHGEKSDIFNGVTGYDYIGAHLGYRYVLRNSSAGLNFFRSHITLSATIENTGFSPAYRPFQICFILQNATGDKITVPVNYDNRKILSGKTVTITTSLSAHKLQKGDYNLSLSFTDKATNLPVSFANEETNPDKSIPCGQISIR